MLTLSAKGATHSDSKHKDNAYFLKLKKLIELALTVEAAKASFFNYLGVAIHSLLMSMKSKPLLIA